MQGDERIGIVPVPAGLAIAVDDSNVCIGLVEQRVGKREPGGAAADDEVVGRCLFQESAQPGVVSMRQDKRVCETGIAPKP